MVRDEDTDLAVAVAAFILLKEKHDYELEKRGEQEERRRRLYLTNLKRDCSGHAARDFQKISRNPTVYYHNFHMDETCFEYLFQMTEPFLVATQDTTADAIPLKLKLKIVLEFLAFGNIKGQMSSQFGLTIDLMCNAIIKGLQTECSVWTPETMLKWAGEFMRIWNFPNTIGAIDGKHIGIEKPPFSGNTFFNNKRFFSIILLAICDASYRFTYVDVGTFGSEDNIHALKQSTLGKALFSGTLQFPDDSKVDNVDVPYFIVGDDALPLHERIMKPFGSRSLTRQERIFNYRLGRARRCIDKAFGILNARWMSLQGTLQCQPERAQKIAFACCLLHNFLMRVDPKEYASLRYVETEANCNESGPETFRRYQDNYPKQVREVLKNYVNSTGAIPKQLTAAGVRKPRKRKIIVKKEKKNN